MSSTLSNSNSYRTISNSASLKWIWSPRKKNQADFVVVDMAMLKELFAHTKCGKCGLAAPDLRKANSH